MLRKTRITALILALGVTACGTGEEAPPTVDPTTAAVETPAAAENAQDAFFVNLTALCGRAFRGEAELGSGFDDEMIMHVRYCDDDEIQIPLHVGEDRSRTWIITRTADGLRLKHDHRLEDGTDDPVTQYGGDTAEQGTATEQSFPADAFTADLIPPAATNVWTITLTDDDRFIYHLSRNAEPRATFVFDLNDEVPPPPAPWGYEDT